MRRNILVHSEPPLERADWSDIRVTTHASAQRHLPSYYQHIHVLRELRLEDGRAFKAFDLLELEGKSDTWMNDMDDFALSAFELGVRFALENPEFAQKVYDKKT